MARDPRFDVLFEPVRIGPVTAPNRFYQTPHATGMGWRMPQSGAALRAVRAEGGWGVVCTEYCSIHPSSDDFPFAYAALWDDDDVRALALTADAIHAHGALAGVELWHGGAHANNRLTREPMLAPMEHGASYLQPGQARAMDRADIRALRRWQRDAARRARAAGFDIVYVYAGHDYLPFQFLSPRTNRRGDEYGGPLENRARLLREMIEDTREAAGDRCAVAVRLAVDELHGPGGITSAGEGREIVALLADLPDLWDLNVAGTLANDSRGSRFAEEGFQEDHVAGLKALTTKPVVGVGRFTSPDTMVSQIRRGVLDFIGAARPSIADPFLPKKIAEGRTDEIRECIGCNICRAANNEGAPLRCTQNPTVGEEWRRAWHPERIAPKRSDAHVLVVGTGPAGLEVALALGRRGYAVTVAEAGRELGGRVVREAALPGLAHWIRVRDHRVHMLSGLTNVEVYRESRLTAADIAELGAEHVAIATGSSWRRDGTGSSTTLPVPGLADADPTVLTPDDVFAGAAVASPVLIYDDEQYAMGGALAERFLRDGRAVTLMTPGAVLSAWAAMTDEQAFVQARLLELGVEPVLSHRLAAVRCGEAVGACIYTGRKVTVPFATLVLVTGRLPDRALYDEVVDAADTLEAAGVRSITRIGDCLVPSSIADAVFRGHLYARTLEEPETSAPVRRERPAVPAPNHELRDRRACFETPPGYSPGGSSA